MSDQQGSGPDRRNELAWIRTEAAHRRTQLANERSFSAWVRTGLALLVTGFAASRLLSEGGPPWLVTLAGIAFIGLGAIFFLIAYRSYRTVAAAGAPGLPKGVIELIVGLLLLLSGLGAFLILNAGSVS